MPWLGPNFATKTTAALIITNRSQQSSMLDKYSRKIQNFVDPGWAQDSCQYCQNPLKLSLNIFFLWQLSHLSHLLLGTLHTPLSPPIHDILILWSCCLSLLLLTLRSVMPTGCWWKKSNLQSHNCPSVKTLPSVTTRTALSSGIALPSSSRRSLKYMNMIPISTRPIKSLNLVGVSWMSAQIPMISTATSWAGLITNTLKLLSICH